jgi:hypothetical protein
MPAEVIDRVHVLARRNSSPLDLTFMDRADVALIDADLTDAPDDDSDDEDYNPATDSDAADDDDGDDASVDSDDATDHDGNGDDDDDGRHDAAIDPPPSPAANFPAMADELAGVPELEPAHDAPIAGVYDAELPAGTANNDNNADRDTVGANETDETANENNEDNKTNNIEQVMNAKYGICKHKCFLAKMFYQNIGPSSVHVFHMY